MHFLPSPRALLAFASLLLALLALPLDALAQESFPPAPPVKLALNPVTNKLYVANELDDSVTVMDLATQATRTIPVGPRPQFIAVNPATNRVYVNNTGDSTITVIDGATDTNLTPTPLAVGSVGPISVNPITGIVYIVRLSGLGRDEVTFLNGATNEWYTIATESFQPIAMAVNALTDTIYVAHYGTGDLRVISGAYDANDFFPDTFSIPTGSHPFAVAANPVTNKVYVLTQDASGPIGIVDGATRTVVFPPPDAGHAQDPKAVAVNPITNRIYAAFANEVIVIDGASNAYTYVPVDTGSGPAGLGIDYARNRIYVAADDGVLTTIDGDTLATATQPIAGGANAIGVNSLTSTAYVLGAGVTPIDGSALGSVRANPLVTSISPLAGDTSDGDATFTLTATSGFSPNALAVRAVYFQLDSTAGAWTAASGSGPYGASFAGLGPGTHTLHAFAADGQDAPASSGPQSNALVGSIASYTFTVTRFTATVSLASSANPSEARAPVTFTASVSGSGPAPTGSVDFLDGSTPICTAVTLSSGSASCASAALLPGSHAISARYSGDASYAGASSDALMQAVADPPPAAAQAALSPTRIDFGGESMGTTSPPLDVQLSNPGNAALRIDSIAVSDARFSQSSDCPASLAPGASCTIRVSFTPAPSPGPLNSTAPASGTLTVSGNAAGGAASASLAGSGEKSLVTHYYRAILGRAPDADGKSFWQSEAARVAGLGADVNEAWFAMAAAFYGSAEYAARARDDAGFVEDLYATFFNRAPDSGGFSYWTGQLSAGLPREVVLVSFMFSPEFASFARSVFGDTAARAEVNVVGDFYRGLLGRLPDSGGFDFWVGQFRDAQCRGSGAVSSAAEAISSAFSNSAEYAARGRAEAQYVADLYNAFLRRGGDQPGVQHWIDELRSGAMTREDVRRQFVSSPEFANRVAAIVGEGCMP